MRKAGLERYLYIIMEIPYMGASIDANFDFYANADLTKYAGKWIAIVDRQIVAAGDTFKEVFNKAKKEYPGKRPLFDWVSEPMHHFLM